MRIEIYVVNLNGLIVILHMSKDFNTASTISPVAICETDHFVPE